MIIDDPQVLREAVIKTGARPTHEGADVILNSQVKEGLEEYAYQMRKITTPIWEERKDKAVKWPV
jgi:hypothetical protein